MRKALHYFFFTFVPNIVLVAGLVLLIRNNLALLAFALLVLSKWQVLLGGPKLWLRNLRDNGCDLIVALSAIAGLILFNGDKNVQVAVAIAYAVWLVAIKPRSGHIWVALQAGICQLVGLSVLFLLGRTIPEAAVYIGAWVVAVISADHLLSSHKDPSAGLIASVWGLIVVQLTWVLWRWLLLYSLFNDRVLVPQAPLILTVLGYGLAAMYLDHSAKRLRKLRLAEYIAITLILLIVIIVGTNWNTRI